ncbi:MAG: six-cysteine ranthipeptide SCIFF [Firmicutes bacterium]|nr:six-cysteine ranthipeptide SCIFF [Bacillota bacterium]
MKHIKIIAQNTIKRGPETGCGECRSACQSACKTSCTVGNLSCEKLSKLNKKPN